MHYYEPLDASQVEQLHEAACRLLTELGVRIHNAEAVEVLASAGAQVVGQDIVRIPRDLVERAIASAPATFHVFDRRGGSLHIGGGVHYHLNGGTMTEVLDYPGWRRRPATLQDVAQITRIVDALDCVHIAVPAVEGFDAPPDMGEILSCAEMLKNTSKFCLACPVEARATEAFVAMAKAVTGIEDLSRRPTVALLATMLPGYAIDREAASVLMLAGREGLPVVLMGGAVMGAQSPATMAGSFVMKAAEELAGLSLVQVIRPGCPCILNWGQIKLDMRTAEIEEAGPEFAIAMAAGAQLSRRYRIPSYSCPSADSKIADLQAGFEFAEGMLSALLCGIDLTVNAGTASKCSTASYELLVLHNEMLRNMLRMRRGMTVTPDTLALDLQIEAGVGADYLALPHTLRYTRDCTEFIHKDLFDATGVRAECPDVLGRAQACWQRLLARHEPAVTEAGRQAVDEVVARYATGSD